MNETKTLKPLIIKFIEFNDSSENENIGKTGTINSYKSILYRIIPFYKNITRFL